MFLFFISSIFCFLFLFRCLLLLFHRIDWCLLLFICLLYLYLYRFMHWYLVIILPELDLTFFSFFTNIWIHLSHEIAISCRFIVSNILYLNSILYCENESIQDETMMMHQSFIPWSWKSICFFYYHAQSGCCKMVN